MKILLDTMKKTNSNISKDLLPLFEEVVAQSEKNQCEHNFLKAMNEHLTQEERFKIYEQCGACKGTGQDKMRKEFALENIDLPLPIKLHLYIEKFTKNFSGKTRSLILDEENNTITMAFGCDDCHKHYISGKFTAPFEFYYERCAGGRMYTLEKALGVKLKINSIEIPVTGINMENPCTYKFDIVG